MLGFGQVVAGCQHLAWTLPLKKALNPTYTPALIEPALKNL
jgi:hypothetical protein